MADTPSFNSGSSESPLGGNATKKIGDIKSGLKVDVTQVKALHDELKQMHKTIQEITKDLGKMGAASGAVGGGSSGYNPGFTNTSPPAGSGGGGDGGGGGGMFAMIGGGAGGGGGMARLGTAYGIMSLMGSVGGMGGGVQGRMDRGREYASGVDKLNVLSQQIYGITQRQALDQRAPLAQFRIGDGGINAVTNFQMQTGVNSQMMARQASGVMASSGYTVPMQDILSAQQTMMSPEVANRMFMMGGSVYGAGGQVKGPMDIMQQTIKQMGLTNPALLEGAIRPGSVTRSQMTMRGIPEELQTQYIQYAQQNAQFQKKGGQGMLDQSNEAHRRLMGIEDNMATQQQETSRVRAEREERYISRHLDNMSTAEKQQQNIITALESIEDLLSGVLGVGVSNAPAMRALSGGLKTGGAIAMGAGMMTMNPLLIGGGAVMTVAGGIMGGGDPTESGGGKVGVSSPMSSNASSDDTISIPVGYGGGTATLNEVKQRHDFKTMHPKMQERLLAMFRANPNLGIGGGWRDTKQQEAMFLQRYRRTSKDTGVTWQGSNWERVSGAPAAPPGRSMHEIGLAADLIGDIGWLQQNASRFGLKTFADVNDEPWHVQPAELPNSRRDYESSGSAWGSDGGYDPNAVFTEEPGSSGTTAAMDSEHGGYGPVGGSALNGGSFNGMSISQIIDAVSAGGMATLGTGSMASTRKKAMGGSTAEVRGAGGGALAIGNSSGAELAARLAFNAGFRGDDLVTMVALAGRESSWTPGAANPNTSDRGLWQVNWSAHKGWLSEMGYEQNDLLDAQKNADAARKLWERDGWAPWRGSDSSSTHGGGPGFDGNGSHMWRLDRYMPQATQAVNAIQASGDPTESAHRSPVSRGGNTQVTLTSTPQITVAPQISFHGMPTTPDLENLAGTLVGMVRDGLEKIDMRTA